MARLKKNKAPGPDGLVNELILLLDREGEKELLKIYNHCWLQGEFPDTWAQAFVVSIFKGKGRTARTTAQSPYLMHCISCMLQCCKRV